MFSMYRSFVIVRMVFLILFFTVILGALTRNMQKIFDIGLVSVFLFFAFVDALISYLLPQLENQVAPDGMLRKVLALSPVSNTGAHATPTYKLLMAVFSLLGAIWVSAKVLHLSPF
ncbi:hypothetical protein ACN9MZ_05030 [Pseudoduganella sp. S-14]|jgi:hypothetical protein|uniref:hypothetical protein n=1 Tax=Pseudoduganella sp. S-14 TaxID=3404065 RepID=UPI003CF2AD1F